MSGVAFRDMEYYTGIMQGVFQPPLTRCLCDVGEGGGQELILPTRCGGMVGGGGAWRCFADVESRSGAWVGGGRLHSAEIVS